MGIVPMENHFAIMVSAGNVRVHCRTKTNLPSEVEREEKVSIVQKIIYHVKKVAPWRERKERVFGKIL